MTSERRWVSTELDEDTHRALLQLATLRGMHPSKLIDKFIQESIAIEAEQVEFNVASVDVKVFAGLYDVRRRARIRSQLVQIAHEHTNHPTEEIADMLHGLCKLAGLSVEDIIQESQDSTVIPLSQDDDQSALSSAVKWLQTVLAQGSAPTVIVLQRGMDAGFSEPTLKHAKKMIGAISRRGSKEWYWELPGDEERLN